MHPVIAAVARTLEEPVEIDGYTLPESTNVNPGILLVQSDAKLYDSPERFDPERFIGAQPA